MADRPANAKLNPLWIISIFIGLSEVVAGLIATQADGWIAGMLAVFAVAYPVAITIGFFWFLLNRSWLFYNPSEFSRDITPEGYIAAIKGASTPTTHALEQSIERGVARALAEAQTLDEADRDALVKGAVEAAQEELQQLAVSIDRSVFDKRYQNNPIEIYVDNETNVSSFLSAVYRAINEGERRYVDPYTYLKSWLLEDERSGEKFFDIGTIWAKMRGLTGDRRLLSEVGIGPGSKLTIVRPSLPFGGVSLGDN